MRRLPLRPMIADDGFQVGVSVNRLFIQIVALLEVFAAALFFGTGFAHAQVVQLNSSGGTSTTDGLRIYLENTSKMQVIRRNSNGTSAGQLYSPSATPPSTNLDNGIFLRANGTVYGPSHNVGGGISPPAYSTSSVAGPTPANPIANGTAQSL